VPFKELPLLEVRLPDAVPEAFDMVLNYIYTDRIDPTKKSKRILLPSRISTACFAN
jgi:BTB/POZ domain.